MRSTAFMIVGAVVVCAAAALLHRDLTTSTRRHAEARDKAKAELSENRNEQAKTERQLEEARHPPAVAPGAGARANPTPESPSAISKMLVVAKDPELRKLSVGAFVKQRRVVFAALLKALGFSSEQLRRFDAIQAEYEEGLLDMAVAAEQQGWRTDDPRLSSIRAQLTSAMNGQCDQLFGPAKDQWKEANRLLGPRQVVNQIIQQNLQGIGALDKATADRLTAILATNRGGSTPSAPGAEPTGYDWNVVLPQAEGILTPAQFQGFKTSVDYYRAQAQMSGLAKR
jgi:hypothetical protein